MNKIPNHNKSIDEQIQHAVATLKAGRLVAFPTETVYGLGADAHNSAAVKKVFAAKHRPATHPLIVHISSATQLDQWAKQIPNCARILSQHFWPGPLTLILPKQDTIPDLVTGGLTTVALRVPRHPLTLEMLRQFGGGIVGPSANTHGKLTPTCAEHVQTDLGDKVDYILDGGECEIGIESTIIYFKDDEPYLVRQGMITANEISRVIGTNVHKDSELPTKIRAPGSLERHYAPNKPLLLVTSDMQELINALTLPEPANSKAALLERYGNNIAVLSFLPQPANFSGYSWQHMPTAIDLYAKKLYACLHNADQPQVDVILVECPPKTEGWAAVIDRLTRASQDEI